LKTELTGNISSQQLTELFGGTFVLLSKKDELSAGFV
jgi:hypothetical protein